MTEGSGFNTIVGAVEYTDVDSGVHTFSLDGGMMNSAEVHIFYFPSSSSPLLAVKSATIDYETHPQVVILTHRFLFRT